MPRPAKPWWRAYSDALDNRKLQQLPPATAWQWFRLMCLANIYRPRGVLPPLADVAFRLRLSEKQAQTIIEKLVAANLIEQDSSGVYFMHDWDEWQADRDVTPSLRDVNHANVTPTSRFQNEGVARGEERRGDQTSDLREDLRGEEKAAAENGAAPSSAAGASSWDFIRALYQQNLGTLDNRGRDKLQGYYKTLPSEWIAAAINEAFTAQEPGFGYFSRIMDRCVETNTPPSSLKKSHAGRRAVAAN